MGRVPVESQRLGGGARTDVRRLAYRCTRSTVSCTASTDRCTSATDPCTSARVYLAGLPTASRFLHESRLIRPKTRFVGLTRRPRGIPRLRFCQMGADRSTAIVDPRVRSVVRRRRRRICPRRGSTIDRRPGLRAPRRQPGPACSSPDDSRFGADRLRMVSNPRAPAVARDGAVAAAPGMGRPGRGRRLGSGVPHRAGTAVFDKPGRTEIRA